MSLLSGKVAFITGAARGQGRSHAIRLASEGADIIAIDACEDQPNMPYPGPTEEDLATTAQLVEELGRRIVTHKADVRDVESLNLAVEDGVTRLGRLDIVSANAGISGNSRRAEDLTEEIWNDMLDVNLSGVWRTCKATIPHIKSGGRGGSIVITSSAAGLQGYAHTAHYGSAKHGLVGLMRVLAVELGPDNIRVNSIHPTQVDTAMIRNPSTMKLFCPDVENPTIEEFAAASQTMHVLPVPWLESIDISNALLFLASDEARFITGVALPVDAGAALK